MDREMEIARADQWRALLPDTMEVSGQVLRLIGPDDYRWIIFNGSHRAPRATRFAYAKDDFWPGSAKPGLFVFVGLRRGSKPTEDEAAAILDVARMSLEDEIAERARG